MSKKCFVIMPFSKTTEKHDEEYWNEFFITIKKIMEENGYICSRSEVGPYKIFAQIVEKIEESDIVIAVLTDFNANVWYELGIRHTLKNGTIMLLQEGEKAPFDINDFGIIFYKDSIGLERKLEMDIENYLNKINENVCDSPVRFSLKNKENLINDNKIDEMKELLWKVIKEIPREKNVEYKETIKQNKILWVDDYPINNEIVINLFQDRGVHFDIAITTKQGMELFMKNQYDIIITDMGRGLQSDAGLDLIKQLKDMQCEIPIIVYASRRAIDLYGFQASKLGAYYVTNGIANIISVISDLLNINE